MQLTFDPTQETKEQALARLTSTIDEAYNQEPKTINLWRTSTFSENPQPEKVTLSFDKNNNTVRIEAVNYGLSLFEPQSDTPYIQTASYIYANGPQEVVFAAIKENDKLQKQLQQRLDYYKKRETNLLCLHYNDLTPVLNFSQFQEAIKLVYQPDE